MKITPQMVAPGVVSTTKDYSSKLNSLTLLLISGIQLKHMFWKRTTKVFKLRNIANSMLTVGLRWLVSLFIQMVIFNALLLSRQSTMKVISICLKTTKVLTLLILRS